MLSLVQLIRFVPQRLINCKFGRISRVPIVRQDMGWSSIGSFDTLQSAVAQNADVVIVIPQVVLHNKINLMNELTKVKRVMQK
jgi:signal recognition particle GTPase